MWAEDGELVETVSYEDEDDPICNLEWLDSDLHPDRDGRAVRVKMESRELVTLESKYRGPGAHDKDSMR